MDREKLKEFIEEQGYRTRGELKATFPDTEIMDSHLDYLMSKNIVGKVEFLRYGAKAVLYYIKYL